MEETEIVLLKEEQTNKRIGLILVPLSSPKQSDLTDFSILAEGSLLTTKGKRFLEVLSVMQITSHF